MSRRTYKFNTPTLRVIDETALPIVSHDAEVIGRLFILRDVTHEYEMETYRQECRTCSSTTCVARLPV